MNEEENHDEIKSMLKKNLALTKDNNRLLRKIRRNAVIGGIFKLVWFAVIIGLPVVLYYYVLQPYISQVTDTYAQIGGGIEDIKNTPIIDFFLGGGSGGVE